MTLRSIITVCTKLLEYKANLHSQLVPGALVSFVNILSIHLALLYTYVPMGRGTPEYGRVPTAVTVTVVSKITS